MKYPNFLKDNDTIGITALSEGVGNNLEEYLQSIDNIKNNNYKIIETGNVRSKNSPSSSISTRVKEFNELLLNNDVKIIICSSGGDFLYEIIPYLDYLLIKNNPKLLMGTSDVASLLYIVTTNLDIATIYGFNAISFAASNLDLSQQNALNIIRGNIISQSSYPKYEKDRSKRVNYNYNFDTKVKWESLNGDFEVSGRIIGGCIDCLRYIPGTPYDKTKEFIEKYKNDGIIWYLDIFSMTSEDFYNTLLQLKEVGWFKYVKAVLAGRVMFPSSFTTMTYQKALKKIFNNIPIVFNADIGHVAPKMTIINGAIAKIEVKKDKGKISQYLK